MGYKFNPFTGSLDTVDSPNGVFEEVEINGDITLDDGGTYTTTLQTITPTANRTVSLPDATGTVALVAGSSGQITYNNAGANAGVSTFTADSSGRLTNSASSAASLPVKLWNGTIFAGTTPHVLIQPSTASAGSWSASGTALGVNTAAAFGGNLLDLQVNGTSQASVSSGGVFSLGGGSVLIRSNVSGANEFRFLNNGILFRDFSEVQVARLMGGSGRGLVLDSSAQLSFASGTPGNAVGDTVILRDAADTLAQRRTTNAQTFRVYGTFTDASNYVRASLSSSSTAVTLAAETAGTGADNIPLNLTAAGTGTVKVNSVAEVVVSSTVAGLPAAPVVGMLTRVTDATAPAVGSTVAGGGAAAALVWYNGANWSVIGV